MYSSTKDKRKILTVKRKLKEKTMVSIFDLIEKKKMSLAGKKDTTKLSSGHNYYAFLPHPSNNLDREFWKDFNRHWIKNPAGEVVGVASCTADDNGTPCEICNAIRESMQRCGSDPVMKKTIESWNVTKRFLVNVLEVQAVKNQQGVTVWRPKDVNDIKILELPRTALEQSFNALSSLKMNGLKPGDVNNLYAVDIIKEGSGMQNTKYSASIMMSPVVLSEDEKQTILSSIKNLDDFVQEDNSSTIRALTGIATCLGESVAALTNQQPNIQMVTYNQPTVETMAPVQPIVQDLGAVINDSIPTFDVPPAMGVQQPTQPEAVTTYSAAQINQMLEF